MSDDAKVTCKISGYQLELSDLRRLVLETALWPEDCFLNVLTVGNTDEISVLELGQDRRKAALPKGVPAPASKAVAPKKAAS